MIRERWLEHDTPRLHYLRAAGDASLASRPTIALIPRGLGKSKGPEHRCSLAHRTGDLATLLDQLALPPHPLN